MRYEVVSVSGTENEMTETVNCLDDAIRVARERAEADAANAGVAVPEDCYTSPDDLAAFGADLDGLPIYVVRAR